VSSKKEEITSNKTSQLLQPEQGVVTRGGGEEKRRQKNLKKKSLGEGLPVLRRGEKTHGKKRIKGEMLPGCPKEPAPNIFSTQVRGREGPDKRRKDKTRKTSVRWTGNLKTKKNKSLSWPHQIGVLETKGKIMKGRKKRAEMTKRTGEKKSLGKEESGANFEKNISDRGKAGSTI